MGVRLYVLLQIFVLCAYTNIAILTNSETISDNSYTTSGNGYKMSDNGYKMSDTSDKISDNGYKMSDTSDKMSDNSYKMSDDSYKMSDNGYKMSDTSDKMSDNGYKMSDTSYTSGNGYKMSDDSDKMSDNGYKMSDGSDKMSDNSYKMSDNGYKMSDTSDRMSDNSYRMSEDSYKMSYDSYKTSSLENNITFLERSPLYTLYNNCVGKDTGKSVEECLSTQVVVLMDEMVHKERIPLLDGIQLVRKQKSLGRSMSGEEQTLKEEPLEASLQRDVDTRQGILVKLILHKLLNFFKTHRLGIGQPSSRTLQGMCLQISIFTQLIWKCLNYRLVNCI
jgi:methyl-accepting chemotaxis protein